MEFALFAILNLQINWKLYNNLYNADVTLKSFICRLEKFILCRVCYMKKDFEWMGAGFVCFVLSIRRPVHLERLTFNFIIYVMNPELQFVPDYFCGRASIK